MQTYHVGFTGTRNGMTNLQKASVDALLSSYIMNNPGMAMIVHHGDCLGADEEFDLICKQKNITRHLHPCDLEWARAHCEKQGAIEVAAKKAPLSRNHDIVNDSFSLIATPSTDYEIRRSGTWATIRYARKRSKNLYVVCPDGRIRTEFSG